MSGSAHPATQVGAALAMWWDIAAADRAEFERWHTGEHFAERLEIPGFVRGTRWARGAADGGASYFVLYEIDTLEVLDSPAYTERVNNPTAWSRKLMAGFRGMVRSRCRVEARCGAGVGHAMATWRFSPVRGQEERLGRELFAQLSDADDVIAAWWLQNVAPPATPQPSAEQKLRGLDAMADTVLLLSGWDDGRVAECAQALEPSLLTAGAQPGAELGLYRLQYSAHASEFRRD